MTEPDDADVAEKILATVIEILETDGDDAVQLRAVARRAKVSFTTIYHRYGNREGLILAAMESWMAANSYFDLSPPPEETLAEGLMRLVRCVFEPWDRSPQMARAYYRARISPGGERLDSQGFDAVVPAAVHLFAGLDREYIADVSLVMINLCYAMVGRLVDGSADLPTILGSIERVVHRLTSDNAHLAMPSSTAAEPPTPALDFSTFSLYGPRLESDRPTTA